MKKDFPFVWGVATASYQIEGAIKEDGRGESIWDRFCSIPGNVLNGDSGEIACDHYHRYREDVQILKSLGVTAYRFSIAWPRIFPQGTGVVNENGIRFYSELVDALLEAGIEPYVTLYHWDLPQALQDRGGWTNRATADAFAEYSRTIFEALGERVHHWITLNEPYCASILGYYEGRHAPGLHDMSAALLAAYNMYLAHGLAVREFRRNGFQGEIGITLNLMNRLPLRDPCDASAAYTADGMLNRWFLDPLVRGEYPKDMIELFKSQKVVLPPMDGDDLKLIAEPIDFLGLNYYNDSYVVADETVWPLKFRLQDPPGRPVTDREWLVTEDGFERMLLRLRDEYNISKIYITENGASYHDIISVDGRVEDAQRTDYLRRHIRAMEKAMEHGVPVKGYFAWSLYDNFEWALGYTSRFGLVYVDFLTQRRIVKQSGEWYRKKIENPTIE